jgi:tetratricopeptide (TPR) repeat protein
LTGAKAISVLSFLTIWDSFCQTLPYYDYLHQGIKFWEHKEYDKAEKSYKKAISLKPSDWQAYSYLASMYESSERYQDAVETYKKLILLEPNNIFYRMGLGTNYFKLQRYHEALEVYKEAASLYPESGRWSAYYHFGRTYSELNRHQEAVEAYKMSIKLDPDNSGNYVLLGLAYLKIGNKEEAIKQYKILQSRGETIWANSLYEAIYK